VKEARSFIKTACSTFVDRKYKVCLSFFSLIFFFFIASSLAGLVGETKQEKETKETLSPYGLILRSNLKTFSNIAFLLAPPSRLKRRLI